MFYFCFVRAVNNRKLSRDEMGPAICLVYIHLYPSISVYVFEGMNKRLENIESVSEDEERVSTVVDRPFSNITRT